MGGDYEIGTYWLEHGHMHDIAADLNGYIFGSETRFFGRNHPTSDVSTDNLRFLSTEQILADMAHLIDHIKQQDARLTDSKVILVGMLFAGNIATWFRVKYPHYVDGIWSSSSYVDARMNFPEYFEAIGEDLQNFGSESCYRRIWRAFRTMENLIEGGRSEVLDEMFHLCHPINVTNSLDVEHFFQMLSEAVSVGIINGGYTYVEDLCEWVTDNDITNDLVAFSEWFMVEHRSPGCFGTTFQEVIEFHAESEWNVLGVLTGRRQFQYLLCTEYGWFTTTSSDNQPFGSQITVNYFTELCRQVFGEWISEDNIRENTERTNVVFGGSRPVITNAFFTNGGLDPHRSINVQDNIGETVEVQTLPCKFTLNVSIKPFNEFQSFQCTDTRGTFIPYLTTIRQR